jgi:hypothetical protein
MSVPISLVDAGRRLCRFSLYERHREHLNRIIAWHNICNASNVSTTTVDKHKGVSK